MTNPLEDPNVPEEAKAHLREGQRCFTEASEKTGEAIRLREHVKAESERLFGPILEHADKLTRESYDLMERGNAAYLAAGGVSSETPKRRGKRVAGG